MDPDVPAPERASGPGDHQRRELPLVVATYVWQAVGLGLVFAGMKLADERGSFLLFSLGGLLSLTLGYTIRRSDDPNRWALPLTAVSTAVLAGLGPLVQAAAYAAFCAVPLAMIYHGGMIGEHFLTVAPYSGQRTTPVHGGCVHGVGVLALLAGTAFAAFKTFGS